MKIIKYSLLLMFFILSCNSPKNPNDMGLVDKLPKGEYVIYNCGSRHIVKCDRSDGKVYWLNDVNFNINGIDGYDAHQYSNKTKIKIE